MTGPSALIPKAARVVVVGGGIIGNSVAYHLAKLGWKDIVLIERDKLTSGTTWHAAGLITTFGSLNETSTRLRQYTKSLYQSLEKETGLSTGFKQCGFVELATDNDYLTEFRRIAEFNRRLGVDVHEISGAEVKSLFPLCETSDVLAGFYVEDDGRVDPVGATMSLAKGARSYGVNILENVSFVRALTNSKRVVGVETDKGSIMAEIVVNCAGMWARQLGEINNVLIPNQAVEHYYLVTERIEGLNPNCPVLEDPKAYNYIRPESNGGLLLGLFEAQGAAWNSEKVPNSFSFAEINPDLDRISPYFEYALKRVPVASVTGIRNIFCGPESFTPDVAPIVGEAPELENYFVAAGMNSIGILTGGGIGRLLAYWIVTGEPDMDVTSLNITRFRGFQGAKEYRSKRAAESLGTVYKCHYPNFQFSSGRGIMHSPIHHFLEKRRAYFRCVSGFEAPMFYERNSSKLPTIERLNWGRESFFQNWKHEHESCRTTCTFFDMSFMSKFKVLGSEACEILNYLCTSNIKRKKHRAYYTQWLNEQGCVLADVTVTSIKDDEFLIIATDTMHRQVEMLLKRAIKGKRANYIDVTGAYALFSIQGPKSKDLISKLTTSNVDHVKFRDCVEIFIGSANMLCSRISYVGELGYELLIPTELSQHVYTELNKVSLEHSGLAALNSLRLEKGFKDYGHDLDNCDSILSSGLDFTCDFQKEFRGKNAVLKQKALNHFSSRLVSVKILDEDPVLFHGETIYRNRQCIGVIRSGSYGFTVGGAVGIGCIESSHVSISNEYLEDGIWEVNIAGKFFPCLVSLRPFYDPLNERMRDP